MFFIFSNMVGTCAFTNMNASRKKEKKSKGMFMKAVTHFRSSTVTVRHLAKCFMTKQSLIKIKCALIFKWIAMRLTARTYFQEQFRWGQTKTRSITCKGSFFKTLNVFVGHFRCGIEAMWRLWSWRPCRGRWSMPPGSWNSCYPTW